MSSEIETPDELVERGCLAADALDFKTAETLFRRAIAAGLEWAQFNLGNALYQQRRLEEAEAAYQIAVNHGITDAWLNLGYVLEEQGDIPGAASAFIQAALVGDPQGDVQTAWLLSAYGHQEAAERLLEAAESRGNVAAAGVLGHWRWDRTQDPSVEAMLRAGASAYPSARVDLARLLAATGRRNEAEAVLGEGTDAGEAESEHELQQMQNARP